MRRNDVLECAALGRTPKSALRLGLVGSIHCFTALRDGRPEAMFGLADVCALNGTGAPWMLGTEAIYEEPRAMLAVGPKIIDLWRFNCRRMSNIVGAQNVRAQRMLRAWKFTVGDKVTMIGGLEFLDFSLGES